MPELKLKVTGYRRASIDADWETHIVDSTLHTVFSGTLDGYTINLWTLNSFDSSMVFKKSGINMSVGDQFSITDINNGIISIEYFHGVSISGVANFSLSGSAKYDVNLNINSIV